MYFLVADAPLPLQVVLSLSMQAQNFPSVTSRNIVAEITGAQVMHGSTAPARLKHRFAADFPATASSPSKL
jgi:hypothetical protein